MSFSSTIKDELSAIKAGDAGERLSILCAMTHTAGAMMLTRGGLSIEYVIENRNVAALIVQLATELFAVQSALSIREQEGLKNRNMVVTLTGEGCRPLLARCGCLPEGEEEEFEVGLVPQTLYREERLARAFLRGAFLGGGSISDPKKGYHLEIVCRYEPFAQTLRLLLEGFGMHARVAERKSYFVLYLKEGESVSDFLRVIGAVEGTLAFENVRVLRYMANDLNRRTNFEEANMQKAALASAQQRIEIQYLIEEGELERLPQRLRETAEARLNLPEASLGELAEELGVGKSCVNHRLQRLVELAAEVRLHGGRGAAGGKALGEAPAREGKV